MYVGTWCQLFSGTTSTATASTPSNVLQDRGSKWRGYSQKCLVWALLAAVKKHAPGKTRAVRKWCKKNCSHDAPLNLGVEGVNMDQVRAALGMLTSRPDVYCDKSLFGASPSKTDAFRGFAR